MSDYNKAPHIHKINTIICHTCQVRRFYSGRNINGLIFPGVSSPNVYSVVEHKIFLCWENIRFFRFRRRSHNNKFDFNERNRNGSERWSGFSFKSRV